MLGGIGATIGAIKIGVITGVGSPDIAVIIGVCIDEFDGLIVY